MNNSDLASQSIDELNNAMCEPCVTAIVDALNHDAEHAAVCDRCNLILAEMSARMNASRTKH